MEKYPEIFSPDDFHTLLQTLSTLQIECNDWNIVHNIYVCLSVMRDKQEIIGTNELKDKIVELWKIVGGNTIR